MNELIYSTTGILILQTQYADIAFFKDRPRVPPSMTNPVVYATISGVSHEPMYGNIGEHKRQAAGKQHVKCSCTCTCTSPTVCRYNFLIHTFVSFLNNYALVNRAPEAYGSRMSTCVCFVSSCSVHPQKVSAMASK